MRACEVGPPERTAAGSVRRGWAGPKSTAATAGSAVHRPRRPGRHECLAGEPGAVAPFHPVTMAGCLVLAASACLPLIALPAAGQASAAAGSDARWPLDGQVQVVRGFAPPVQRWSPGHRGVDLLGREGAPVRAAAAGSVSFAGPIAGRGVVVVAHRDGTRTTYEPVTATVTVGAAVIAGDAIGRLAAAAGHCLPAACLHWGRLRGDVYLDPMLMLRAGPVRLLPVWAGAASGPAAPGLRRVAPSIRRGSDSEAAVAAVAPEAASSPTRFGLAADVLAAGAGGLALLAFGARAAWGRRAQSSAGSAAARRV